MMQRQEVGHIIFIILLLLIDWTSFALSQPIVKVWESENSAEIEKYAELYLRFLDVQEDVFLTIWETKKIPEKMEGITVPLDSPEPDVYQIFRVLIDASLKEDERVLVLAHEMVHIKQYAKKELKFLNEKKMIWKGKEYDDSREYNRYMPWEKEAYDTDLTLVSLAKLMDNEDEEFLAECVPEHDNYPNKYTDELDIDQASCYDALP